MMIKQFFSLRHPAFQAFLLISCGLILYSFILSAPFKTLDDQISIYANPDIQDVRNIPNLFTKSFFNNDGFYYRPLVAVSFTLERYFFGLNAFYFNVTNIILHLLIAMLIFAFFSRLFRDPQLGFFSSLLFLIHPVNVEAVANIAGRSILLCAFFEWSALLSFSYFIERGRRQYFYFSLLSFGLALLSKESCAAFPAMAFVYAWLFQGPHTQKRGDRFCQSVAVAAPFFLIFFIYLIVRHHLGIFKVSYVTDAGDYARGIFSFFRGLLTYGRLLLWPVDLHFDRIQPVMAQWFGFQGLLTMSTWACLAIFLVRVRHRFSPAVVFLLAFISLRFLPLSQIVPIRSQADYICLPDHFLYVPSAALVACLIIAWRKILARPQITQYGSRLFFHGLVSAWILFLLGMSLTHILYTRNEIALFERTLSFTPEHVRMNVALGLSYAAEKKFAQAEACFRRALLQEPTHARARVSLATALLDQGKLWEGLREFEKVVDAENFQDLIDRNKKLAYRLLIERYSAMIENGEDTPDVFYSLGVVDAVQGRFNEAVWYFEETLARDPGHYFAKKNLCNSFLALGDDVRAQECFEELKKFEPREMSDETYSR